MRFTRSPGTKIAELTKKEVSFDNPDIVFVADFRMDRVNVQVNSLFIYGRYKKLFIKIWRQLDQPLEAL